MGAALHILSYMNNEHHNPILWYTTPTVPSSSSITNIAAPDGPPPSNVSVLGNDDSAANRCFFSCRARHHFPFSQGTKKPCLMSDDLD
ncbi:hypothetical protein V6N13_146099 [Hibiscus sabdariffa]|uniref:Uncharacterized protein n=1 Tax=Hibiscus sabdariffa TaxID=183260 RepID=A0ABR2TRK9_9ROSI